MNKNNKQKSSSKNNRNSCSSKSSCNSNNKKNNSKLCCFSYIDYIVLASALAVGLAEELSDTDLGILSTFFAVLSDELALITTVNGCNSEEDELNFVPPVPDIALTSSTSKKKNNTKKNIKKKK
ncbi:hypothetical protein [Terrisporobacter sp.]|uniref:hypothetical protein n=1 Tax=Terrisporobacter sp. TaxID=1965305 RepID=UPI0026210762|nr:hypothetical protein [Terrisporobacter sp.]